MEILIRQRSSFPKQKLRLKFSPRDLSVRNAGPSWRMLTKRWGLRQKLNTKRQITSKLEQHKNFIQPSNECRWEKCAESSRSALISKLIMAHCLQMMYILWKIEICRLNTNFITWSRIKLDLKQRFEYFLSFVKFLCTDIGLRQANVPGKTQWSLSPDNTTFYHQVTPSYYTNCLDMKT